MERSDSMNLFRKVAGEVVLEVHFYAQSYYFEHNRVQTILSTFDSHRGTGFAVVLKDPRLQSWIGDGSGIVHVVPSKLILVVVGHLAFLYKRKFGCECTITESRGKTDAATRRADGNIGLFHAPRRRPPTIRCWDFRLQSHLGIETRFLQW